MPNIKKRNVTLVVILTFVTFYLYSIYWVFATTKELRANTKSAPNPWIMPLLGIGMGAIILVLLLFNPAMGSLLFIVLLAAIIGFVAAGFWYYWRYSKAVEELTGFSAGLLFALWILVWPAAVIVTQMELNKKADY